MGLNQHPGSQKKKQKKTNLVPFLTKKKKKHVCFCNFLLVSVIFKEKQNKTKQKSTQNLCVLFTHAAGDPNASLSVLFDGQLGGVQATSQILMGSDHGRLTQIV